MTIINYYYMLFNLLTNVCMFTEGSMSIRNCIYASQGFHAEQMKTVYHYKFKHFSKNYVIFILCTSRMKVYNECKEWMRQVSIRKIRKLYIYFMKNSSSLDILSISLQLKYGIP